MIHAIGLSKRFKDVEALRDLDLDLPPGRSAALLGPNGAGKSTLLRILAGLIRPTAGQVRIGGYDPWREPKKARELIFYLPQSMAFPEELSGEEVLDTYVRLRRMDPAGIPTAARRFGLDRALRRCVSTYSGGMRQRLGLALLVVVDPPVLLLDEPGRSLDREGIEAFRFLFSEWKERGKTLLFSTHSLEDLARLADVTLTLEAGHLVSVKPHPGVPRLLEAVP